MQQQEIGITLRVTPRVTANRQVLNLTCRRRTGDAGRHHGGGPEHNKRNSHNQVLVADGETAVIGGLTQTQVTKSRTGIPILMNLPLIGRLFCAERHR